MINDDLQRIKKCEDLGGNIFCTERDDDLGWIGSVYACNRVWHASGKETFHDSVPLIFDPMHAKVRLINRQISSEKNFSAVSHREGPVSDNINK